MLSHPLMLWDLFGRALHMPPDIYSLHLPSPTPWLLVYSLLSSVPSPYSVGRMVSFPLKGGHILDVSGQTFPFEYIPQPNAPFSHIYNRELQLQYSSLEYDLLLHIFYKFVILRFLFLLDNPSHGHFVNLHKLTTTRILIHLDICIIHSVGEIHHIYHTTYDLPQWLVASFSLV